MRKKNVLVNKELAAALHAPGRSRKMRVEELTIGLWGSCLCHIVSHGVKIKLNFIR